MALDDTPGSPDWWLLRLGYRLRERLPFLEQWWAYYKGEPPLPEGPDGAHQAYIDFMRKARTNFLKPVVNSTVHRLAVIGIADGQGDSADEAWGWWQRNRLDSTQRRVYRAACALSEAYVIVGRHPADASRPLITAEHPEQVIVEHDPATGDRAAALKIWHDQLAGMWRATLYLPDVLVRYASTPRGPGRSIPMGPRSWEPSDPQPHKLGAVPVVPFPCLPDLGVAPEPEFAAGMDIQDRINLSMLNRMTAERYSAFRQKWVVGHQFRRQIDPATGLEVIDPDTGAPVVEQPFKPSPGVVWASEGSKDQVQFGEFSQTELMGYLKTHQADVMDLLVVTATPTYYYSGDLINISADAVTALDTNHIAKVREHQAAWGEAWEDTIALAAKVAGSTVDYSAAEVRWADPRTLNPAVLADLGAKERAMGFPLETVAEDMGASPQRVKRITAAAAADTLLGAALTPTTPPAAVVTASGAPSADIPPRTTG